MEHINLNNDNKLKNSIFKISNCKGAILYSVFLEFQVPFLQKLENNNVIIENCIFQGNPSIDSNTKCIFNKINLTLQIQNPLETNHCWQLITEKSNFLLKLTLTHYLIIFLVIMWIIIIIYLCKTRDKNQDKSTSGENVLPIEEQSISDQIDIAIDVEGSDP